MSIWKSAVKAGLANIQMEEELADHQATGNRQDMEQAKDSYAIFNSVFKWGTIAAAVTTLLVVMIIASRAA